MHAHTHTSELMKFSTYIVLQCRDCNFPSQQGGYCRSGKVRQKVVLVPAVQLLAFTSFGDCWSLGIPWHLSPCSSLFSKIFPHFQDISSSRDLHLFLSGSPSSFQDPFFLGTLLFGITTSFCNPRAPVFSIKCQRE